MPAGGTGRDAWRAAPGARPLALEGFFQSLGQSLGESYLGAFALSLGSGALGLGLIGSVPTAGTALAQAFAGRLRARSRGARRFIGGTWAVQALAYAALGSCVLLPTELAVPALCVLALATWSLAGVTVPAWTALVSQVVPRESRGRFFGLRGAAQQAAILVAIVGGGALLALTTSRGGERAGFVLLFLVAGAARAAGAILLVRVPERAGRAPAADLASGAALLRSSAKFRRLCLYLWGLHFATHVSSPFFVPYMLRDLRLSYAVIGLLMAAPALIKMLTLGLWGRLADRAGPGPMFRVAGWFVVPVSALWLVSGNPWWILAAQVYSGIAWGAFELAQAAALVQTTRGREGPVALFNLADGMLMVAGSLLGGAAVVLFERSGASGYLGAMGLSAVLRALPAAVLLWRIRGIGRPLRPLLGMALRLWAVRPTRGPLLRPWAGLSDEAAPEAGAGPDPGKDRSTPFVPRAERPE